MKYCNEQVKKSKFTNPENFIQFKKSNLPDNLKLFYGFNDWEDSFTCICLYFLSNIERNQFKRLWIKLKYPEKIYLIRDVKIRIKHFRNLFWALLKRFVKLAEKIRKSDFILLPGGKKEYKNWYDCFKEALKDTKLRQFIREYGEDQILWVEKKLTTLEEINFSDHLIIENHDFSIIENKYWKLFKGYNYLKVVFEDSEKLFIPLNFHGYFSEINMEKIRNMAIKALLCLVKRLFKEKNVGKNNELEIWKDCFYSAIVSNEFSKYILFSDAYPLLEELTFADLKRSVQYYERKYGNDSYTRLDRSKNVNTSKMDVISFKEKNKNYDAYIFEYRTRGSKNSWRGFLKFLLPNIPKEPVAPVKLKQKVVVNCTCPDYKYVWAASNNKQKSGIIGKDKKIGFGNNNNGAPASVKNPESIPGMCKHLLSLEKYLTSRFRKYPVVKKSSSHDKRINLFEFLDDFIQKNPQFELNYSK